MARERTQRLASALARLPKRERSVIMLSHYQGLTSPEVGALTGLKPSSVRVLLFRAGRKVRMLLAEGPRANAGAARAQNRPERGLRGSVVPRLLGRSSPVSDCLSAP